MKPTDLHLFRALGRPAPTPDGEVFVGLATPDLAKDRYQGVIWHVVPGDEPVEFTRGPRDSSPVMSPDGQTIVFLRAGESGPAQLHAMPRGGGEPRQLADHPLGASGVTFSPDGGRIAYLAAVPEPGRYGTPRKGPDAAQPDAGDGADPDPLSGPDKPGPEAEPPRLLTRMSYRIDGKGFLTDKPEQIFVLDLTPGAEPRQLTAEPGSASKPAFTPDGARLVYVRASAPDALHDDVVTIGVDSAESSVGDTVASLRGTASAPVVAGDTIFYIGTEYDGSDFAGRCPGLFAVPLAGGEPLRLTDPATVHVDAMPGEPVVVGNSVLVAISDRGSVGVRAVPITARSAVLDDLPTVVGGERVVKAFTVTGSRLAVVVSSPDSTGDLLVLPIDANGVPAAAESVVTDVSSELRAAGLGRQVELTGSAPDGHPVHGWLVLPEGDGPHPVLLAVHGGPHAAYGWGVFDEAQMYAAHGYAVVLGNPRGSAGYGEYHGRAIVGALGTVDVDDLLALLDVALSRAECDARVGVMGGSYGGFMTSWLASHAPGRFVAAISERAVNAWDSFAGSSDIGYFFAASYTGPDRETQWAASPLAYADDIDIPFLVMHSEQDWRCPIEQGQRLFVALKQRGHETEMLVFPGEGHELSRSGKPQHRRQRFEAILGWWDRYLPVGG